MKTKIQIKSIYGSILFEYEKENNTIKQTLEKAVDQRANLQDANLQDTNLQDANLQGAKLQGAKLQGANLQGANLQWAKLQGAELQGAELQGAKLQGANLQWAKLQGAELQGAELQGAKLQGAELQGAKLQGAELQGAKLQWANLQGAKLQGANLQGVNLQKLKYQIWIIPEEGSFIAWKKASGYIIKLEIPNRAKRTCQFVSRKCRASHVKVLEIQNVDGSKSDRKEVCADYDNRTKYIVGKITKADKYNDSLTDECTNGIHFFVTRQEALNW